jgi:hypothetical protein
MIVHWVCVMTPMVKTIERSVMFVNWQWFEFTCRALSDTGRLATYREPIVEMIAKRGIRGLRMHMESPTQSMVRADLGLTGLTIRNDKRFGSLFVRDLHGMDDVVDLRIVCNPWALISVAGVTQLTKLTTLHLVGCDVDRVDCIQTSNMDCLHISVGMGVVLPPLTHLTELNLVGGVGLDVVDVICGLSGLKRLGFSTRPMVIGTAKMPCALEELEYLGDMMLDVTCCTSLASLTLCDLKCLVGSIRYVTTLRSLDVIVELSDDDVRDISNMTGLTALSLCDIDAPMNRLSVLTNLVMLSLPHIGGEEMQWVSTLSRVEKLSLTLNDGYDYAMSMLSTMSNLKKLYLYVDVPEYVFDISPLMDLVGLTELRLDGAYDLQESGLMNISKLTSLSSLNLGMPGLTDVGLGYICQVTTLTKLNVLHALYATRDGLMMLKGLPLLKSLLMTSNQEKLLINDGYNKERRCFV